MRKPILHTVFRRYEARPKAPLVLHGGVRKPQESGGPPFKEQAYWARSGRMNHTFRISPSLTWEITTTSRSSFRHTREHLAFEGSDLLPIRLRLIRAQQSLKQADLAKRLSVSQQAYAKLERPGANPTLQTIADLEAALGQELMAWA